MAAAPLSPLPAPAAAARRTRASVPGAAASRTGGGAASRLHVAADVATAAQGRTAEAARPPKAAFCRFPPLPPTQFNPKAHHIVRPFAGAVLAHTQAHGEAVGQGDA